MLTEMIDSPIEIVIKTIRDLTGVKVVVHRVRKVRIGLRVRITLTLLVQR